MVLLAMGSTAISAQAIDDLAYANHAADEHFGKALAITSEWLVVGVPNAATAQQKGSGKVAVYRNVDASWQLFQELTAVDASIADHFGFSVAVQGNVLVVGAPGAFGAAPFSGQVFVYEFNGTAWGQVSVLTAPDASPLANFGHAVAVEGRHIAVGAINGLGPQQGQTGAAYVFQKQAGQWVQQQKLMPESGADNDKFGYALAFSQQGLLAIGAPGHNGAAPNAGAAYVFELSNNAWQQAAYLLPQDAESHQYMGHAVAMNQTDLVVGAYQANGHAENSGALYYYQQVGQAWQQQQTITAPAGQRNDHFGAAVSIAPNELLVGAPKANVTNSQDAGAAYYFEKSNGAFVLSSTLQSPNVAAHDFFGSTVAITQGALAITALLNDGQHPNQGAVYTTMPDQVLAANQPPLNTQLQLLTYPNPARQHTLIQYNLWQTAAVAVQIYDNQGRAVKTLQAPTTQPPGQYQLRWNLTNNHNSPVGQGLYHYQLVVNGHVVSQKIIVQ